MTTAEQLVRKLSESGRTCCTAESCTGGGVGSEITSVPGSSAVFLGGVISYDNSVKSGVLGVSEEILATKGAVSSKCACAMADGVRRLLKADFAISVTGIAGPGGGSAEKPVGLVWFALSSERGTFAFRRTFAGGRAQVRDAAVHFAVELLAQAAAD